MEVDLANILFSWFLHIDLACIFCNWEGYMGPFAPFGAVVTAVGTVSAGVYDAYNSYAPGDPGPPPLPNADADAGTSLNDLFGQTGGGGVGDTANPTYSDTTIEDRIAADEREQQRLNDLYRMTHPGATTAGPPAPTTGDEAADAAYNAFFTVGTRKKVVE